MEIEEIDRIHLSLPDRDYVILIQLSKSNLREVVDLLGEHFIEYSYLRKKIGNIIGETEVFELQFISHSNGNIKLETMTFGDWIMEIDTLDGSVREFFKTSLHFYPQPRTRVNLTIHSSEKI